MLGLLLFAGYVVFVVADLQQGQQRTAAGGHPRFSDFTSTYAGSVLLQHDPAVYLYDPERMLLAEYYAASAAYNFSLNEAQIARHSYAAWMYPPIFSLFILPLAFAPYLVSLLLWSGSTLLVYLAALAYDRDPLAGIGIGLAAPSTLWNLAYGQTGFLSAGLIGLGLNLLQRSPTIAGITLGMAAFKPHLGVLIPLALIVGGYWWVLFTATLVVGALVVSTSIAFGAEHWVYFFQSLFSSTHGLTAGAFRVQAMVTPLGLGMFYGASNALAWLLQGATAVLAIGAVTWGWRGAHNTPAGQPLRNALLCSATLLLVPLAYFYDLTLLALALCWLYGDMRRRGAHKKEYALLLSAGVLMLLLFPAVYDLGLYLGPLPSAMVFGLCIKRLAQSGFTPRSKPTPA